MNVRTILLAMTMLLTASHAPAADDYKTSAEYLALRDTMHHAFNNGDSAAFFPALRKLEDYLLKQDDMHAYYTQRCNEIVFLMNRQRIFEAYKKAQQLSKELREKKLDKEMYMAVNMMGHINRFCGNKEAAKDCFRQALDMMEKAGYWESMPPIYMNIVNVALNDDPDEAQQMLSKAAEIAAKYSPERVFDIETRRTLSYFNSGNREAFMKGYEKYREGVAQGKSSVHGRMMEIYHDVYLGKTDEALKLAQEELGEDGREAITVIYEQAGRWKEAYESLQKQYAANDSIANVVLTNSMQGIHDEIQHYDAEREISRNRTILLSAIVALLLILLFALIYILLARRRHVKQLKQAYDRVLEADKMKTTFVRNITHEVRTPLNIISGFAQVIADPDLVASPQERKELAATMQKNTNLITTLIDELLQLSLNETTTTKAIKEEDVKVDKLLQVMIDNCQGRLAPDTHLQLESSLPEGYKFHTSEEMFKRIVSSLLDNAIKNTPSGSITLKTSADERQLTIVVEDTGHGIPAGEEDRIFEHFVKLDAFKEGLGLGLPLARTMAERLGGSLTLDSSYHGGARFIVRLDL